MTTLGSILDARSTFGLTALAISWVAVASLAVVVGNLLIRIRRLETGMVAPLGGPAYGGVLGRRVADLFPPNGGGPHPRVLLFLSSACGSCARLVEDLASGSWTVPMAVAWTDRSPVPLPPFPPSVSVLADGAGVSSELGIRVTPFAVVAGDDGSIVKAGPVGSPAALARLADGSEGSAAVAVPYEAKGV